MAANALVLPPNQVPIVERDFLVTPPWRSSLQNALNNLQAQITALAALEGDSTSLETALAALQAEVDAAEASIAAHVADTGNPHSTTAAQVGADPTGTAATAVAAHEAALDPHPQYLTAAEGNAAYDTIGSAAAALTSANTYTDGEIAALSTVYQPVDGTLTALAGQNWAADALPIGSGADTVAQVAFAANTFPGRSSAGGLVAKAITDFAFSLLDDSSASAARTTLETPSGTYAPTFTAGVNVASIASAGNFMYVRVGPIVIVLGTLLVTPTTGGLSTAFSISLPIASNLGATTDLVGGLAANASGAAPVVGYLFGSAAGDNASVIFFPPTNAQQGVRCWFGYVII
jgi:hypothetical protein